MTLFLASVRDAAEAAVALRSGADIIDVKEPSRGALGAADRGTLKDIVALVGRTVPVSATIGDLEMNPDAVREAVLETAATGVDYVKFGVFAGGNARGTLRGLAPLSRSIPLIMVMFADRLPDFDAIEEAARAGMSGVMLDTARKGSGALRDHLDDQAISALLAGAKSLGLMAGLAGSLRLSDIPYLLRLSPDLLGFRGALCRGDRNAGLDLAAAGEIRAAIPGAGIALHRVRAHLGEAPAQALC